MWLSIQFWNKRKQVIFLLFIRILTLFILIDCGTELVTIENLTYFKNAEVHYYKIYDNYVDEAEREFMHTQDSLSRLKQFCKWLNQNDSFSYENINMQGILLEKTSESVKSIQVNHTFFRYNAVEAAEGSLFSEEDYPIDSMEDIIPVLVGSEYSSMQVGERFVFHYMGHRLEGQVKGILNSNSSFLLRDKIKGLNSYIVMPSLEFNRSPETKEEYTFQIKLYLDKAAGIIISEKPARVIKNEIEEICSSLNLIPYGIEGYYFQEKNIWGSMGKELKQTNQLFLFYIVFISIVGLAVESQSRILQLKRKYAIANLNGFSKRKMILGVIAGITAEAVFPGILVIFIDSILLKNTYLYLYLWFYLLCTILVSSIVCCSIMVQKNYWKDMRGKKYGTYSSGTDRL